LRRHSNQYRIHTNEETIERAEKCALFDWILSDLSQTHRVDGASRRNKLKEQTTRKITDPVGQK
jgi:hypothetical protein